MTDAFGDAFANLLKTHLLHGSHALGGNDEMRCVEQCPRRMARTT